MGKRKTGLREPRVDPQEFVYAPTLFSAVRCSLHTRYHQPDIPLSRCSLSPIFPHTHIPSAMCSFHPILLQPCVPSPRYFSALCSISPLFPLARFPLSPASVPSFMCFRALRSLSLMFLQPDITSAMCVPSALCFLSPMYPQHCIWSFRPVFSQPDIPSL